MPMLIDCSWLTCLLLPVPERVLKAATLSHLVILGSALHFFTEPVRAEYCTGRNSESVAKTDTMIKKDRYGVGKLFEP